jgi:CRISPR-associated protein Cas1
MIKRTLYFSNPYYLHSKYNQLVISTDDSSDQTIPMEDIGHIVIDHYQIKITPRCITDLMNENVVIVWCDEKHLPTAYTAAIEGNHIQNQIFRGQIEASKPSYKSAWQMIIKAKLKNQATALNFIGQNSDPLIRYSKNVKSGDPDNLEGQGAKYYWTKIYSPYIESFTRERYGSPPNNALNYGYAILRAVVARCLIGSGLHPTIGINHANKYNPYCLADDVMEPFRPWVDLTVYKLLSDYTISEVSTEIKQKLLEIPYLDCKWKNKKQPLMIAVQAVTATLARYFLNKRKKIQFPEPIFS